MYLKTLTNIHFYAYRLLIFSFSASIHCFMQFYVFMSEVSINMKWCSGLKEHETQGKLVVTSSGRVVVALFMRIYPV